MVLIFYTLYIGFKSYSNVHGKWTRGNTLKGVNTALYTVIFNKSLIIVKAHCMRLLSGTPVAQKRFAYLSNSLRAA